MAGGVGGLLAVSSTWVFTEPTRHRPIKSGIFPYAGNGNVAQIVNLAGNTVMGEAGTSVTDPAGSVTAHYEYDPFGNIVCSAGAMAEENPFRFSTKWHDDGTGLVYYGWISVLFSGIGEVDKSGSFGRIWRVEFVWICQQQSEKLY